MYSRAVQTVGRGPNLALWQNLFGPLNVYFISLNLALGQRAQQFITNCINLSAKLALCCEQFILWEYINLPTFALSRANYR
jgi:hypothetical protein